MLHTRSQPFLALLALACMLANTPGDARAESKQLFPGLSVLSEADVRDSTIAFVNTTSTPGLSGAVIDVDTAERDSRQWRSNLGFMAEFTIRDRVFNGYWGMAVIGGQLDDNISLLADNGTPVDAELNRTVVGLRSSLGISLPVNRQLKFRPYLSLTIAEIESDFQIFGLPATQGQLFDTTVTSLSTTGTIDAIYTRWYGDRRLELNGQFHLIYNDTESEDNPFADVNTWSQTAFIEAKYSNKTGWFMDGRAWRWHLYANHSNFLSQSKLALGYTGLFEVGTGLEWSLNIKPLDWFGWEAVGINLGVISSRDVIGYNIGLTAR